METDQQFSRKQGTSRIVAADSRTSFDWAQYVHILLRGCSKSLLADRGACTRSAVARRLKVEESDKNRRVVVSIFVPLDVIGLVRIEDTKQNYKWPWPKTTVALSKCKVRLLRPVVIQYEVHV